MTSPLQADIRQLFSYGVLADFERLAEADVRFTFRPADVYLSVFAAATSRLEDILFAEHDDELLKNAQVFERFLTRPFAGIGRATAGLVAATLYWLAGYSANALVLGGRLLGIEDRSRDPAADTLIALLSRQPGEWQTEGSLALWAPIVRYLKSGREENLHEVLAATRNLIETAVATNDADLFVSSRLLERALDRLSRVSLWSSVRGRSPAPPDSWQSYMSLQLTGPTPLYELWPSQRTAIARGLLDPAASLVLRMPTSAGKTKITELAFVNDLLSDPDRRCLYLAPYRALVTEVESTIGVTLSRLGFPVASLYGGSEANELEVELARVAKVLIATPEKIAAVLRLSGGALADYATLVLDEGHVLDSWGRGTAYELQLASLRPQLTRHGRVVFLSAVIPNSEAIAEWLGGSVEALARDDWQPTSMRVGVVRWPENSPPYLTYVVETGQPVTDRFFVPRLFEQERWQELFEGTGRYRSYVFPKRDNASVAAALSFLYARSGPVIIYARRRDWTELIAERIVDRRSLKRAVETNLASETSRADLEALATYLRTVLGDDSLLARAVERGCAFHHAGLPQGVRLLVEDEFRRQTIRLLIATNTLAQGVNLPAKTVIVHSLPESESPVRDFWNLAGRAGRALRETEGEVIVLATASLKGRTLRRFLDKNEMEGVESRLLTLVRVILRRYPAVSNEALRALSEDEVGATIVPKVLADLDVHLLAMMAEDLAGAEDDFNALVANLFATHQAERERLVTGIDLRGGISDLIRLRRDAVAVTVPELPRRRRFSRVGLSLESCLSLEQAAEEVRDAVASVEGPSLEALEAILVVACRTVELKTANPRILARAAWTWIRTGSYPRVREDGGFADLEEAIEYVETTVGYTAPWVLNGFIRLLADPETNSEEGLPRWLRNLPHYMRYGVDSPELLWVMSLGVQDRRFAEWLLNRFQSVNGRLPTSFREFLAWAIASRDHLARDVAAEWPSYFGRLLAAATTRYERIAAMLGEHR